MSYRLVIAEKPSVAQAYAKVLGATNRNDGYWEGNSYLVSWWTNWLRAKRWRRSSGQTNEEKQPITHRQRMWYNP